MLRKLNAVCYAMGIIKPYMSLETLKIVVPPPMPPHVLMNFVVFPPGCGESVTDF
jgi:hypothetical protein